MNLILEECINCGLCAQECAQDAIKMAYAGFGNDIEFKNGIIDLEKCTCCFECIEVCVVEAIDLSMHCGADGDSGGDVGDFDDPCEGAVPIFKNAGGVYLADINSHKLFPDKEFNLDGTFVAGIAGVGIWIAGYIPGSNTLLGGVLVNISNQEKILDIKRGLYNQNGGGYGLYFVNVSAPGAIPRAALFYGKDGSFFGWHHTTIGDAPNLAYHLYLKMLQELKNAGC